MPPVEMAVAPEADRPEADVTEPPAEPDPQGRRAPTIGAVVGSGFALWGLAIGLQPLHDNSFMTHLATGRIIVADRRVPTVDPYSFTANGDPWVVQSWLASTAYGLADRFAGLGGVRLLQGLLVAALAAVVWSLTGPARSLMARVLIAGTAAAAGTGLWVERPLLIGLLCFAGVIAVVEGERDPRWLVPLMWIWVNSHGSFPFAGVYLVLLAVGTRLDGTIPRRELRALAWTVAGLFAALVNPLGPRLLTYPLVLLQRTESFALVEEWQRPEWNNPWQILFAVQLVVALALLWRSRSWRTALPLVVFGVLAATSARNIAVASVVLVPGMALAAAGLGSIDSARRPRTARLALAVVATLGLLFAVTSMQGPDTQLAAYPEDAVTWLEDRSLLDDRVVAPDYVGNYLEARYGTEAEVFVDDRVDMYPVDLVRDVKTLLDAGPESEAILADREAGAVLWQQEKPLSDVLRASESWRVAWEDDHWIVFLPV